MFVDSHCHLDFDSLATQREDVLRRAREAGVGCIVTIGTTRADSAAAIKIAEAHEEIYCTIGIHPHEAEKPGEEITAAQLAEMAAHPKVIAIGETGLDYFYDHAPREAQQRNFREHIRACIQTGLPISIHTRDAEGDTIRILREAQAASEGKLGGVLHCYSSNRKLAEAGLEMGYYFSFSGMLTFKKSDNVRDIARDIPMDRLLVETDAPYLAPVPFRGKPCEPSYVVHTAACLAEVKGVSLAEIESATTDNFFRLFKKAKRP